jgi:hypothetical protein
MAHIDTNKPPPIREVPLIVRHQLTIGGAVHRWTAVYFFFNIDIDNHDHLVYPENTPLIYGANKVPKEVEVIHYFTKDMLDCAVRLWARSAISLIDVRYRLLQPDKPLQNYQMPTNMFVYTQGGAASIKLNHVSYQSGRFGIFHGGKGTELSIHPACANLDTYMVLYKAEPAPFYKRDIHRLLERINPFIQVYGFSPENPIFFMEKLQSMHDRWNLESALNQFHAKVILYQLVYEIYKELEAGTIRYFEPDYVELVKQYLDQRYTEPVSIQLLAETLPISRSLLSKLFRKREHKRSCQRLRFCRRIEFKPDVQKVCSNDAKRISTKND